MVRMRRRADGMALVSAAAALAGAVLASGAGFGAGAKSGRSNLLVDAVARATLHDRVDPVPTTPFSRATAHDTRRAPASPAAPAAFPPSGPDWSAPSPAKPETDGTLHTAGTIVARLTFLGAGLFGSTVP